MAASFKSPRAFGIAAALALVALAAGASVQAAPARERHSGPRLRSWQLRLSPAVDDLSLAQISFPAAHRGARLAAGSLGLAAGLASGVPSADYAVVGAVRLAGRVPRALVLLANRPSPLEDPTTATLRLNARPALGKPSTRTAEDAFTRGVAKPAALCDLPLHRHALVAGEVLVLSARGKPPAGFGAAAAIADAYNAACGLPYPPGFKSAIAAPAVIPSPPGSGPPGPPAPVPPPPERPSEPPGCGPCKPSPTAACPLARPSICAVAPRFQRRSAELAH